MSYIYNSYQCSCGKCIEYAWLLADEKFEKIPNKKYIIGNQFKHVTHIEVVVKCPKCKMKESFYYTLNGKLINKENLI